MPGVNPNTLTNWRSDHLVDVALMSGTNGAAVGVHNGFGDTSGFTNPLYKTNAVNGLPSLVFASNGTAKTTAYSKLLDNVGSSPNGSSGAFPTGLTIFAVVKPTALADLPGSDRRAVVGFNRPGQTAGSFGLRKYATATSSQLTFAHMDPPWTFYSPGTSTTSYEENVWTLIGFRTNGLNVKSWKGISGDRAGTNPDPTYGQWITAFSLGANLAVDGQSFDGEIAYFGAVERAVTDQEWLDSATFLLDRFGIPIRNISATAKVGTTGDDVFVTFRRVSDSKAAFITNVQNGQISYSVNGGAAVTPVPMWRPISSGEFCNMISLPTTSPIAAGATVTVTIPEGSVATQFGNVEAATGLSVTNLAGEASILPQVVPDVRPMKLGMNLNHQGVSWQPYMSYRNLFKMAEIANPSGLTVAEDGTVTDAGPYGLTYLLRSVDSSKNYPGHPGARYGRYRVRWSGPTGSTLSLVNFAGDTETVITHVTELENVGGTVKERFYDVTAAAVSPAKRPLFSLVQSAHAPLTDVWVGLASYDPDSADLFDDLFVEKFAGLSSIRFMDAMQTNFSNLAKVDELTLASFSRYTVADKTRSVGVSRVETYTGAPYWNYDLRHHWKVTTSAPHGMERGQSCFLRSSSTINVTLAGRGVVDMAGFGAIAIIYLSPTEFVFIEYIPAWGHRDTVTPFTGSGATIEVVTRCGMPVEMMAELCRQAGTEYCHVTYPHPFTDATVTSVSNRLATSLPAGIKLRLEVSNEPWNFAFSQNPHFSQESVRRGLSVSGAQDSAGGVATRSFEVYDLAKAAFVAAGRPATDVELVLNSWNATPTFSTRLAQIGAANGRLSDATISVYTAPYSDPPPLGRLPGVDYSTWTLERIMDHEEAFTESHDPAQRLYDHRANMDAGGATAWRLGTYECQNGFMAMSERDNSAGAGLSGYALLDAQWDRPNRETMAISLHPRMYGVTAKRFQYLQDAGAEVNTIYTSFHGLSYEFPQYGYSNYGDHLGLASPIGRGDGSGVDNLSYLVDGSGRPKWPTTFMLESVRGQAAKDWIASGSTPPVTANFATVSSPRSTALDSITITFSVAVTGVTLNDFTLSIEDTPSRRPISLTGVTLSGSGTTYTLSGLGPLTGTAGNYILTLVAAGSEITGPSAETLAANVVRSWQKEDPAPAGGHSCFARFWRIRP
jgi:hypothetical protein